MKQVWPNYYSEFFCIADACKHTCCAGWEIDIDKETLAYYQTLDGAFGERLQNSIVIDKEGNAAFCLTADECCPFLNEKNLCNLILSIGEEHLCQICTDHPRFRNFFSDRTEVGLGLCCEAAANLILSQKEKMMLCEDGTEHLTQEEQALILFRQKLLNRMQERTKGIEERWGNLLAAVGISFPAYTPAQWEDVFENLERLDETWNDRLAALKQCDSFAMPFLEDEALAIAMEQLTCCLLYRHMAGAVLDGDIPGRVAFCVLAAKLIGAIFERSYAAGKGTLPELADITRQFSSEIEYSEENICALLDYLDERI